MENKIYSRSVNKQGLALRVIDKKSINRSFSAKEVEDLCSTWSWVQCDKCSKWRVLLDETTEDVENIEKWYCEMNSDAQHNSCEAPERTQLWYEMNCNAAELATVPKAKNHLSNPDQEANDPVLEHLLTVSETGKDTALISQHYFHDTLLKAVDVHDEVEDARKRLADANDKPCSVVLDQKPSSDECCIRQNVGENDCESSLASDNERKPPPPTKVPTGTIASDDGFNSSDDEAATHQVRSIRTCGMKSTSPNPKSWGVASEHDKKPPPHTHASTGAITSDDSFSSSENEPATHQIPNVAFSNPKFDKRLGEMNGSKVDVDLSNNEDTVSVAKRAQARPEVIDLCSSDEDEE